MKKNKDFKIETFDIGGHFIFFTQAQNHKKALENMLLNSSDYKNIISENEDLTIKISELKIII